MRARDLYAQLLTCVSGVTKASQNKDSLTIITLSETSSYETVRELRKFLDEANLPGHYLLLSHSIKDVESMSKEDLDELISALFHIRREREGTDIQSASINLMTMN